MPLPFSPLGNIIPWIPWGIPVDTSLVPYLDQLGIRLGPDRDQLGTRSGPDWDQFGTSLGPDWVQFGTGLGPGLVQIGARSGREDISTLCRRRAGEFSLWVQIGSRNWSQKCPPPGRPMARFAYRGRGNGPAAARRGVDLGPDSGSLLVPILTQPGPNPDPGLVPTWSQPGPNLVPTRNL